MTDVIPASIQRNALDGLARPAGSVPVWALAFHALTLWAITFWASDVLWISGGALFSGDCNQNGTDDATDIAGGTSSDCNADGLPDECPATTFALAAGGMFPIGQRPRCLAVADMDEDGHLDVLAANELSGEVAISLGDGRGNLGEPTGFPVGSGAESLCVADFDGDGHLDVAVASGDQGPGLSLLVGEGDGKLGVARGIPSSPTVRSAAAADFDKDGRLDLATADGRRAVSVLLGRGDGTFSSPADYTARSGTWDVLAADFDGDGFPDLAVANMNSSDVSIFLSAGDGTLRPGPICYVRDQPRALRSADLDGDGAVDLLTANSGGTFSTLLGNGDGTFQPASEFGWSPYDAMADIAIADFDGDGKADVIFTASRIGEVSCYRGKGDGTFHAPVASAGGDYFSSRAADLDEDGRPDLVAATGDSWGLACVFLNRTGPRPLPDCDGNGIPDECDVVSGAAADLNSNGVPDPCEMPAPLPRDCNGNGVDDAEDLSTGAEQDCNSNGVPDSCERLPGPLRMRAARQVRAGRLPSDLCVADLNGDGAPDLVTADLGSASISVILSHGDGTFEPPVAHAAGQEPCALSSGDFDGDGNQDLAVVNAGSSTADVFLGTGDGGLASAGQIAFGGQPFDVLVEDIDGDGAPDLLVAVGSYSSAAGVWLHPGNGDGTFRPGIQISQSRASQILAADLSGDTVLDVLAAGSGDVPLAMCVGGPSATFSARWLSLWGGDGGLAAGDLDGDGVADAVAASVYRGGAVLLGRTDGALEIVSPIGGDLVRPLLVDLDADGKLDLVGIREDRRVVEVRRGTGAGSFGAAGTFAAGGEASAVVASDMDGDGVLDLSVAARADDSVALLFGMGNASFIAASPVWDPPSSLCSLHAADFDGDGADDIALCSDEGRRFDVLLGGGDGTYAAVETYLPQDGMWVSLTADLDGDEKVDLLVGSSQIYAGHGDGSFSRGPAIDLDPPEGASWSTWRPLLAEDLDGDGLPDLAYGFGHSLLVAVNAGGLEFVSPEDPYEVVDAPRGAVAADLDGDGIVDLAVANEDSDDLTILRGLGGGIFGDPRRASLGKKGEGDRLYPFAIAGGDFNRDGVADLVTGNYSSSDVSVLLGNGAGDFLAPLRVALEGRPEALVAEDIDGDRIDDIAAGTVAKGGVTIIISHGDGTFAQPFALSVGSGVGVLAATDADRSGSTDLLVLGEDSDGGRRSLVLVMNDSLPVGPDCEENRQLPGDCDQSGDLEIGDAIAILRVLFLEESETFPCGDGTPADAGNVRLLDWQGDGAIDVADAVGSLTFLFLGGPAHVLSDPSSPDECVPIVGCPGLPACSSR